MFAWSTIDWLLVRITNTNMASGGANGTGIILPEVREICGRRLL
jgi:hypothetical protein